MDDAQLFLTAAQQAGYAPEAALAALAWARQRLAEQGPLPLRLYIFRSAGNSAVGPSGGAPPSARPRVLLAFRSADTALSFAQQQGLGNAPRLATMGPGQLLTALLQRPTIGTLLVVSDEEAPLRPGLPHGLRIERAALLDQLQQSAGGARGGPKALP